MVHYGGRGALADLQSGDAHLTRLSRVRSFAPKAADEVSEVSAPQRWRGEVLRGMRGAAGYGLCELRTPAIAVSEILSGVRAPNRFGHDLAVIIWSARDLHARTS